MNKVIYKDTFDDPKSMHTPPLKLRILVLDNGEVEIGYPTRTRRYEVALSINDLRAAVEAYDHHREMSAE